MSWLVTGGAGYIGTHVVRAEYRPRARAFYGFAAGSLLAVAGTFLAVAATSRRRASRTVHGPTLSGADESKS